MQIDFQYYTAYHIRDFKGVYGINPRNACLRNLQHYFSISLQL